MLGICRTIGGGSAGAFRSLPPSAATRPVIAEITRWKSIGDALAPNRLQRALPRRQKRYVLLCERERPYGPTTCLSAGAERGVRSRWNIPGDRWEKSALLQWRPAPTTAAVSAPIAAVWRRWGEGWVGVGGRRRPWGRESCDFYSISSYRLIVNCENRGPSAALALPMLLLRIKDDSQHPATGFSGGWNISAIKRWEGGGGGDPPLPHRASHGP